MLTAALFTIARIRKQPKCPLTDGAGEAEVQLHDGMELSCKKAGRLVTGDNTVDLEGITPSEVSQTEADKCHRISLTWNLRNKINQQSERKQTRGYEEHFDG